MGIEENKKTALAFWEKFSKLDVEGAMALTSDDITWWIAGNPKKFPLAGLRDKAKFGDLFQAILKVAPKGIQMKPLVLTAEGNRVAMESESYAETNTGIIYRNQYHYLMYFSDDGKIKAVREYLDTMYTNEVFCA